jgi:aryl sulfotransferase
MKNIIWLASYPKSGNTWLRVFLTNLLRDSDEPVDINRLDRTPIASARAVFDDAVGFEAADLSPDEADRLRPEVYRLLSHEARGTCFFKIHDACIFLDDGCPLVPPDVTRGAIYVIRSPLDVAVSFANHLNTTVDNAIERMSEEDFCFAQGPGRLHEQLRQKLLSWSGHVRSWTEAESLEVHVMRYEDMKQCPEETFTRAVQFAGLEKSRVQIEKALKFSHFSEMQRQENEKGFKEKPLNTRAFFRKGEAGAWREELNASQVEKIIAAHGDVMKRFGYLDEKGEPVF